MGRECLAAQSSKAVEPNPEVGVSDQGRQVGEDLRKGDPDCAPCAQKYKISTVCLPVEGRGWARRILVPCTSYRLPCHTLFCRWWPSPGGMDVAG